MLFKGNVALITGKFYHSKTEKLTKPPWNSNSAIFSFLYHYLLLLGKGPVNVKAWRKTIFGHAHHMLDIYSLFLLLSLSFLKTIHLYIQTTKLYFTFNFY